MPDKPAASPPVGALAGTSAGYNPDDSLSKRPSPPQPFPPRGQGAEGRFTAPPPLPHPEEARRAVSKEGKGWGWGAGANAELNSSCTKSRDLLSAQAASRANAAFNRLTDAVESRSAGGDRALDEMTRECLRPLLKAWLDENLPGLVERLVREEIERVARSGR